MEEKTNGIKKLFESDKARKIIVIIGIIGIALIFISSISVSTVFMSLPSVFTFLFHSVCSFLLNKLMGTYNV